MVSSVTSGVGAAGRVRSGGARVARVACGAWQTRLCSAPRCPAAAGATKTQDISSESLPTAHNRYERNGISCVFVAPRPPLDAAATRIPPPAVGGARPARAARIVDRVLPIERVIHSRGGFLRRRDLLRVGFTDRQLRTALARSTIFRVRHGWYSVPGTDERAVRAVRIGGRLTALSALETLGIRVPRDRPLQVAVPMNANRLRRPTDRRTRIRPRDAAVRWVDVPHEPGSWRVPPADALVAVLASESRDVAVAVCSAALHKRLVSPSDLARVFERAPKRVRAWARLVSVLDESHGETYFRTRYLESGRTCTQQVTFRDLPGLAGAARFDFRVSEHVYVEIDGGQHDPDWTGGADGTDGSGSSWERDLERDAAMAIRGDRVLHFGYRLLYTDWPTVLAAIDRAIADDAALAARRRNHPYRPRARRKRRRSAVIGAQ